MASLWFGAGSSEGNVSIVRELAREMRKPKYQPNAGRCSSQHLGPHGAGSGTLPRGSVLVVYWLLFAYFALGAVLTTNRERDQDQTPLFFFFGMLLILLAIGLRYEVGADWQTYEFLFSFARYASLGEMMEFGDPGYQFVNWLVRQIGLEVWLVNLICAGFFTWGLTRLARAQANPWLAVLVAIPYLVVVVAMGYSRQAAAIGVLMAGLAAVQQGASTLRFLAYVAVATLFHRTALVTIPLVIFAGNRTGFLNLVAGVAGSFVLYDLFLSDSVDVYVRNYVEAEYTSQGAAVRVAMSVIPAFLFFTLRRAFDFNLHADRLWRNFSLAAFGILILLFTLASSTAVDRLALYLIPLQVAVLPRTVRLFRGQEIGTFLVLAYSFAVLFVWLNFADHSKYWLPYRIYPIF
ncbi:MAG: EpsG family protein [Sphingomonas sp.]|nr:EpsG family protein [Sphingomonas sp.]